MSDEETYLSDTVLNLIESRLIRQALILYQCGFKHISAAQMAALAERIRGAAGLQEAREAAAVFIAHQTAELKAKQNRAGKAASWCKPATAAGKGLTLGELVVEWITSERYLQGIEEDILKLLDRAKTLQRFWSRFQRIYRYGREFIPDTLLSTIGSSEKP